MTAIPAWIKRPLVKLLDPVVDLYSRKAWSQEGEDLLLLRIFARQERGFYVDVGAHHPRRFSNTYLFYRRGWRGINIEPNPQALAAFRSARGRDINLQMGVADAAATLRYHLFDDPALNTFDAEMVRQRLETTPYRIVGTIDVPVERLATILGRHLPAGQPIDFLSVDVEGLDLDVLRSNDWQRFRPGWVLAESLGTSLEQAIGGAVFTFMSANGYELFGKTYNTLFFRERPA